MKSESSRVPVEGASLRSLESPIPNFPARNPTAYAIVFSSFGIPAFSHPSLICLIVHSSSEILDVICRRCNFFRILKTFLGGVDENIYMLAHISRTYMGIRKKIRSFLASIYIIYIYTFVFLVVLRSSKKKLGRAAKLEKL